MARMGLKLMLWAPIQTETATAIPTYDNTKMITVGKMVSLNVAINNAEGELYADDALTEYAGEFSSADLDAETDSISLENQAKIYGATYSEEDGFSAKADDTAPYGGVSGYQVLQIAGVRTFRGWHYAKAKAIMPDLEGNTKGDNISFGTQPVKMKITSPSYGPWYRAKDFTDEAEAKAWCEKMLGKTGG